MRRSFRRRCLVMFVILTYTIALKPNMPAQKEECKVLGTSAEEETKLDCASTPPDLGDKFCR